MRRLRARRNLVLWLAALLLYAATTARDLLPADSGEFQLVAAGWGIAHPPGYPLYTMAGALWVRILPFGSVPFRLNLLSAVLAATTLVLTAGAVEVWGNAAGLARRWSRLGGLAAALALGTAGTFWAQATTANIRMPTMLFAAWGFLALAHYRAALGDTRQEGRALFSLALALGLGVGHHPSLIFIAVGWGLYLLLLTPRLLLQPSRWLKFAGVALLAWGLPQLYLPVRSSMADVPLAPGDLNTWSGFWEHVLARGFGGDMFAFTSRLDLALRLPLLPTLFRLQFPPLILATIGVLWLWLAWRHGRIAAALAVAWLIQTLVTITYRAPQTVEYLMPAYLPMALTLGLGLATAPEVILFFSRRRLSEPRIGVFLRPFVLLLFAVLVLRLVNHVPGFAELANDASVRSRLAPILEMASAEAKILADWRWATPLWVMQAVEDRAPASDVTYVYPVEGLAYEEVWRTLAEDAGDRPLYTTHHYHWEGWTFAPVGGGYRLYRRPLTQLPAELGYQALDETVGPVRLLGYRWAGEASPGRSLELQLAWQAVGPQTPAPSFTARLWADEATLLDAGDRNLGSETAEGEVRFTQLTLQLPVDGCADTVYPTLGVYTFVDGGTEDLGTVSLPAMRVACAYPKLPTARAWPGLVLWRGPFLRGVDYDTHVDSPTVAHLHWCGPGAGLIVKAGDAETVVAPLDAGECRTSRLPIRKGMRPRLELSREDGSPARLLSLPLPMPREGERYLPFGDQMVLVGSELDTLDLAAERVPPVRLTLQWRTTRPLRDDYAVSTRLLDADRAWIGMHDIQPGVGAIPTLKWVTRDSLIRDPHIFPETDATPAYVAISVYERFRMTPVKSVYGDVATYRIVTPP